MFPRFVWEQNLPGRHNFQHVVFTAERSAQLPVISMQVCALQPLALLRVTNLIAASGVEVEIVMVAFL